MIALSDALFHLLKRITCKRVAIGTCPCPACRPVFVSKLWSLIANMSFHYLIFIFFYSRFVLSLCSHICESDHQILTSKERKSKKSKKKWTYRQKPGISENLCILLKNLLPLCAWSQSLLLFPILEHCVEFDKKNVSVNWTALVNATTPATEFWE